MRPVVLIFREAEGLDASRRGAVRAVRETWEKALMAARRAAGVTARRPAVAAKGIIEATALVDGAIAPELCGVGDAAGLDIRTQFGG
jgi:hypothetical protein